ncbi:MAG: hypothetical protein ACLP0J_15865 [Solirubrobacteraceae bacterium]
MVSNDRTASERAVARVQTAAVIAGWAPVSLSEPAAAFAREVVTAAGPGTPARAKALLFAAGRCVRFPDLRETGSNERIAVLRLPSQPIRDSSHVLLRA